MTKINFEGCYKGKRDYLQGGDLFDGAQSAVQSVLGKKAYVKSITFREMARKRGSFFIDSDHAPEGFVVTAVIKIQNGDDSVNGIFATDGGKINKRIEYDESLILENSKIDEENMRIIQTVKTDFTSCEEVVALTKALHNQVLPTVKGKWIFTLLNMKGRFLNKNKELFTINIKQNLGGIMTRSDLLAGDRSIGTIGFTVL